MQGPDACGTDWARCVNAVAEENMQQAAPSSLNIGTSEAMFTISDSARRMLESRRHICERVLDRCVAVRNHVFDDFIRDIAPELRRAKTALGIFRTVFKTRALKPSAAATAILRT
jgi:hypothetical protein